MDVTENEDAPVYQYYTIVTDPLNECIEQDNKSLIYLTFDQNENNGYEPEPEVTELQANEASCESDQQNLSNVKMVTFGSHIQILMTNAEDVVDDDSMTMTSVLKSDLLTTKMQHDIQIEDDLMLNAREETEEQLVEESETDYQQIKLEDGTCAIIDKKLLNSIIGKANVQSTTGKHKKYRCMYLGCGKVYSTPQHLTVHVRNHTGIRPYNCTEDGCDKAFATGYSLKAHLRTHTGEKPYACSVCTKQFKTSGDLQKHMRTHTGEKPFRCPIEGCGRSFTTSNIRKVHIRSHTGERPYVCEEPNCGKAFASATNYKNHMRIHSGEKPYVCTFAGCDKRFTEYSSLYKHNMVHKPCKPFKCNYCGQLCKQESTLKAHKRTIHSIVITDDGTEILVKREGEYSEVILEISDQPNSVFLNDDDD